MNNNLVGRKGKFIINFIYILIIILVLIFLFKYAINVFLPFIIAFIFSCIIEPMVKIVSIKLKLNRTISTIITIILILLLLTLVLIIFSLTIYDGLKIIYNNSPEYVKKISLYFDSINSKIENGNATIRDSILLQIYNNIINIKLSEILGGSFGSNILSYISNLMTSLPQILITVIVSLVSIVFISISFDEVKEFIVRQLPKRQKIITLEIKRCIFSVLKKYIRSYTALMLITFIELTVLFVLFDIKPSASLAFVISFVDVLPILGIGTIMIPWSIFLFIAGDYVKGSIIIAIYILVAVIRQIIEPKIIGKTIGLHPIVTLVSIYVGLKLLGIIGAIILPITLIIIIDLQNRGYIKLWKEKT